MKVRRSSRKVVSRTIILALKRSEVNYGRSGFVTIPKFSAMSLSVGPPPRIPVIISKRWHVETELTKRRFPKSGKRFSFVEIFCSLSNVRSVRENFKEHRRVSSIVSRNSNVCEKFAKKRNAYTYTAVFPQNVVKNKAAHVSTRKRSVYTRNTKKKKKRWSC